MIDLDHHSAAYAEDPIGALREAQATGDIGFSTHHEGFWTVFTRELGSTVLTSPETYSNAQFIDEQGVARGGLTIPSHPSLRPIPSESDLPEWRGYRKLLNPLFAPAAIDPMRPRIAHLTDRVIDNFIERGQADLVFELANPLPALVTLDILGIDHAELEFYSVPFHDIVAAPAGSEARARAMIGMDRIHERLQALVRQRRIDPRNDYISILAAAEIDGQPVDDDSTVRMIMNLLGGGVDTTTALLSNTFLHLDDKPDLRARLSNDPQLLQKATEEYLRYFSPILALGRTATHETTLDGDTICPRDRILVPFAIMNRDPATFEEPDQFIPDRAPNRHVAFGLGIHRCLGSNLARVMFQCVMDSVLRRLPDFRVDVAGSIPYESRAAINGWWTMPVTFTPGVRTATAIGE